MSKKYTPGERWREIVAEREAYFRKEIKELRVALQAERKLVAAVGRGRDHWWEEVKRAEAELAEARKEIKFLANIDNDERVDYAVLGKQRAQAELADCNQRLTDARGIIKKLTTVDKEYLKQGQRTEAELASMKILAEERNKGINDFADRVDTLIDEREKAEAERDSMRGLLARWRNQHSCGDGELGEDSYKCALCEDTDNALKGGET